MYSQIFNGNTPIISSKSVLRGTWTVGWASDSWFWLRPWSRCREMKPQARSRSMLTLLEIFPLSLLSFCSLCSCLHARSLSNTFFKKCINAGRSHPKSSLLIKKVGVAGGEMWGKNDYHWNNLGVVYLARAFWRRPIFKTHVQHLVVLGQSTDSRNIGFIS